MEEYKKLFNTYINLIQSHEDIIEPLIKSEENVIKEFHESYIDQCSKLNRFINSFDFQIFAKTLSSTQIIELSELIDLKEKLVSRSIYHLKYINNWLKTNEEFLEANLGLDEKADKELGLIVGFMTLTRILVKDVLKNFEKFDRTVIIPEDHYLFRESKNSPLPEGHPFLTDNALRVFNYLDEYSYPDDKVKYTYIYNFLKESKVDINLVSAEYFRFVRRLNSDVKDRKPQQNAVDRRRIEKLENLYKEYLNKAGL